MSDAFTSVRQSIKEGKSGEITLCKTSPERVFEANFYALKYASTHEMAIIYALFKHPFQKMEDALTKIDVYDPENAFIDGITRAVGGDGDRNEDVIYLSTPHDLTNLGTAVSVSGEKLEERRTLLVIDSLSSLLTYNSVSDVDAFLGNLRDRITTLGIHALIFHDTRDTGRPDSAILQHIDHYRVLEQEDLGNAVVETEGNDYLSVKIPLTAATSVNWNAGDELTIDITEQNTLALKKQRS